MVKIVTDGCDFMFNSLGFGVHDNIMQFQMFLCLLNIIFSFWPIVCYLIYTSDIHVVFWLGALPMLVNLSVPILLFTLNMGVNFFQFCGKNLRAKATRLGCFGQFLIIGAIMFAGGLAVFVLAEEKAREIIHDCGNTEQTRMLEQEWEKADTFYAECDPNRERELTSCPDFEKEFPKRVFVDYLYQLEYEFECTGFCRFDALPLFNKNALPGVRCASMIGTHVSSLAMTVGVPTMALGAGLIYVGILLSQYDHL